MTHFTWRVGSAIPSCGTTARSRMEVYHWTEAMSHRALHPCTPDSAGRSRFPGPREGNGTGLLDTLEGQGSDMTETQTLWKTAKQRAARTLPEQLQGGAYGHTPPGKPKNRCPKGRATGCSNC